MNTEMQKKWFIYVNDHHEGPFSVEEVFQKQKSGAANDDSYVWCEGMADWQPIPEVNELHRELQNKKHADQLQQKIQDSIETQAPQTGPTDSYEPSSEPRVKMESKPKSLGLKLGVLLGTALFLAILSVAALAVLSRFASEDLHSRLRPTFNRIVDQVPALGSAIKVTPPLTDVKADDLKELDTALTSPLDSGAKIGIALSTTDANRPFFYIASNLPGGTKLDIHLVGNGETLLNKLQFYTQTTVTLRDGFTRSEVILGDGGQPVPKGEYIVYVSESTEQDETVKNILAQLPPVRAQTQAAPIPQGTRFLFTKIYFLGGERDQTYLTRLKAFHEKVKESADKELQELKQYSDTLSQLFTQVSNDFSKAYAAKKPSPALKANWQKSYHQWQQFNSQLDQSMQTWTKETLQNEFFYGKAYEILKGTAESMKKLFEIERSFLDKPSDRSSFDIQQGKAFSEAREAIELLQNKMKLMLNAPKTQSGLPTRDGL